jgi:hypothetical protein
MRLSSSRHGERGQAAPHRVGLAADALDVLPPERRDLVHKAGRIGKVPGLEEERRRNSSRRPSARRRGLATGPEADEDRS